MNRATEAKTDSRRAIPRWVQIVIWMGLTALLVFLALGVQRSQEGHVQPGRATPDVTLSLYSGYEYNGQSEVKLSNLLGKVVFINFWASWCKPCEQEATVLEEAWKFYQPNGKVVFLGVDYVDTEPEARIFLKKFGSTYPNGPDLGTRISQAFRTTGVPETYIIDTQGILNYVKIGPFTSVDEIKAVIDPLIP